MNRKSAFGLILALCWTGLAAQAQTAPLSPQKIPSATAQKAVAYSHLPLSFEPNHGQTSSQVQWLARGPESTLFLSGNDATVEIHRIEKVKRNGVELPETHSASLRMSLVDSQAAQSSAGEQPQPGKANYFTGKDSSQWQRNIPLYGQVRLSEVYPGVSLLYHGESGQLEYDFVVAPQADPTRISLGFTGAKPSIAANGDLLLPIPGDSTVRFDKPVVYQMNDGVRTAIDSSYLIASDGHVSFELGQYDHTRELVIDPKLVFLGTLGAGNYPYANNVSQITVDSTGAMYFIGTTNDPTYPITPGSYQTVCGPANSTNAANGGVYCGGWNGGSTSAYITKISADGTTLVYSTYLSGGGGYEQGTSIAVDASGIAYLLGATASNDFPVTSDAFEAMCQPGQSPGFHAPQLPAAQCNNFGDGGGTEYTVNGPVFFFAKLSADGSSLIYSSFLGGSGAAYPVATALDSSGNWYLYGQTSALLASNIYPGSGSNSVQFPGVSSTGYQTVSTAYYNTVGNGLTDPEDIAVAGVLSKFSNDGHTLLYGTFFADETNGYNFDPTSLAVGANGIAFIGGYSNASAIPTTSGAVKGSCTTPSNTYTCTTVDGFVAAFDTTKTGSFSLVYSTRIGGSATSQGSNIPNQEVLGVAADSNNDAYVTGYTYDQTFPVPATGYMNACNTADPSNVDNCDTAFVLELNPAGTSILAGSFLSGPAAYYESSVGYKVALDSSDRVYLYGTSADGYNSFPLVNAVQGYSNNNELYIATMSSDLTKLLFSTRFGNPSLNGGNVTPVNGLALDPSNNIYFAGTTNDTSFAATPGAYATAVNSGTEPHTFFAKLTPVLSPTSTTLTISPSTVTTGQNVTFNVTVAGTTQSSPTPTGTVTLTNTAVTPAATLATVSLNGGTGSYMTSGLAAGTYQVTATYSADDTYDVSTSSTVTLTVNNAVTATITLGNLSQTYTGSPLSATATTIPANQPVTITYNGSATAPTNAGSYSVVATIASGSSYTGTATGTLVISPATATITLGSLSQTYTGSPLSVTATTTPANQPVTITYNGSATAPTNVGSYSVVATIPTGGNYAGTATATLTISKSSQSITFGSIATQSVGNTVKLSATSTSGLAVSFASSTSSVCSVSGTTATMLSAGTCTIQASQAGNADDAAASPVSVSFAVTSTAAGFKLIATPNSETIRRGDLAAFLLEAQSVNGFSGSVKVVCSGGPADSVCGDFPQTLKLSPNQTALAISGILFPKNTTPGTYILTFTGTSGSTTASTTAKFTVQE